MSDDETVALARGDEVVDAACRTMPEAEVVADDEMAYAQRAHEQVVYEVLDTDGGEPGGSKLMTTPGTSSWRAAAPTHAMSAWWPMWMPSKPPIVTAAPRSPRCRRMACG